MSNRMSNRISILERAAAGGLAGLKSSASGNSQRGIAETAFAAQSSRVAAPDAAKVGNGKAEVSQKPKKRKPAAPKPPTEHQEQAELFRWSRSQIKTIPALRMLFAIPNGAKLPYGKNRNGQRFSKEAMKLKKEGLEPGVPDTFLAYPAAGKYGLFIEMKRAKKSLSTTSPEQLAWHSALSAMGYRVEVCYGWEAARDVILNYLEGK